MKNTALLIALLLGFLGMAQSTATYDVTFTSNWSQTTHPHSSGSLPANAHWSKLVGVTHNATISFWELGALASPGIEDVAELGNNTVFFSEINQAIAAGNANLLIDGDALNTAGGEIVINGIETNEMFPLLTLVSMIAPSPDWFIGINSVSLVDGDGSWREEISVDLYPLDSGTDSGTDYTSPNEDTNPKDPIANAQGIAPFSNEIIGTMTLDLQEVVFNVDQLEQDRISIFPNPSSSEISVLGAPSNIQIISLFNVLGSKVKSVTVSGSGPLKLSIAELPQGVYMLQLIGTNGERFTKKVVKQ